MKQTFIALTLILFALLGNTLAADKPNVVIFFSDDQGYQDLGCFGSPNIKTPNIDGLAKKGVKFTNFYSAYCVCSASRASLQTGCYQGRISMKSVLGPHSNVGLNPEEETIADILKPLGYATMCIGKWHCGDKPETLPTAQGYDHYFGYPYSNDMARVNKANKNDAASLDVAWKNKAWKDYNGELYRDEEIIEKPVNQITMTDRYADEAVKFVEANKGKPFFLYYANSMPHVPLFVSDDRYDPDPKKAYKLTIEHIDACVGRVVESLKETGALENTLIVFTSDNGPWLSKKHHGGSALPLRAGKATIYEGGMRVPCVMSWLAKMPQGKVCDQVGSTIDLLPTIAKITGAKLPKKTIDGLDISKLMLDPSTQSPHDEVGYYYYRNNVPQAARFGKWKIHLSSDYKVKELYNLDEDIAESKNLVKEEPEVAKKLAAKTKAYHEELLKDKRPMWGGNSKKKKKK